MGTSTIPATPSVPQTVHLFSERLRTIRRQAECARTLTAEESVITALDTLCQQCEEAQTEAYELLLRAATPPNNPLDQLTGREREVALFLAQGLTNKAIGARLFLSDKTVKTHVSNLLGKLNVSGRSGVAQLLKGFVPETTPME